MRCRNKETYQKNSMLLTNICNSYRIEKHSNVGRDYLTEKKSFKMVSLQVSKNN